MPVTFRLLKEADVRAVLSMDDLIETMASALQRFSSGRVTQPVRTVIPVHDDAFLGLMPALVRADHGAESGATRGAALPATALGAKLVTVFGGNAARGLDSHLASIVLLDAETGALVALLDGRYITEARTAAVSAVSSRLLARKTAASLAIIGSGVQARSHLEALSRVHRLRQVSVWSPQKQHRDQFVDWANSASDAVQMRSRWPSDGDRMPSGSASDGEQMHSRSTSDVEQMRSRWPADVERMHGRSASDGEQMRGGSTSDVEQMRSGSASDGERMRAGSTADARQMPIKSVATAGEAVVGADIIVLATASPTPVLEDGWVKPGAHVISVGACRPNQREMDPALVARARLFVDSRAAALVESGDVLLGMQERRFGADHIVAELGELVAGASGRRSDAEVTIFKSLGLAVEDVTAADLAYRRAVERGVGTLLEL